jgi:hypothetical protein
MVLAYGQEDDSSWLISSTSCTSRSRRALARSARHRECDGERRSTGIDRFQLEPCIVW